MRSSCFVSHVRLPTGERVIHNIPGTPRDADMLSLLRYTKEQLVGDPIHLSCEQAHALLTQFRETIAHRRWHLWAVAILRNHIHAAVGVPGDPEPSKILRDLKSYGSRALNKRWGKPTNGNWWASRGSKRKLKNDDAIHATVRYVIEQQYPLLIWTSPIPELGLSGGFLPANRAP